MKKLIILSIVFLSILQTRAQDMSAIEKTDFLIIYTCKKYDLALKVAEEAAKHLKYELDLRGHEYNKTLGLSIPQKECNRHNTEFPVYIQRGRVRSGHFISVEYTSAYNNFTVGYYIVVVASYPKEDKRKKEIFSFVKKHYEDAYYKTTDIYMGCIH